VASSGCETCLPAAQSAEAAPFVRTHVNLQTFRRRSVPERSSGDTGVNAIHMTVPSSRRTAARLKLPRYGLVGSVRPALVGWAGTRRVCAARPPGHQQRVLGGRYSLLSAITSAFGAAGRGRDPGHSEEVGLRAQETFWRAGRRVLDCPASNRILAAGQHRGSTSAIRTALNALAAN
jgi:hypothetical protein